MAILMGHCDAALFSRHLSAMIYPGWFLLFLLLGSSSVLAVLATILMSAQEEAESAEGCQKLKKEPRGPIIFLN